LQNILIPDYLEGTHLPNSYWKSLYFAKCWFEEYCDYADDHIIIKTDDKFSEVIRQDVSLRSFLVAYFFYIKNSGKNYVLGKNLTQALRHTKTDVSCGRLPKNFSGFLFIPTFKDEEGLEVLGAFCNIHNNVLKIGFISQIDTKIIPGFLFLNLEENRIVGDLQINNVYHEAFLNSDKKVDYKKSEKSPEWIDLSVLLNAIIYITNSCEELTEEVNQFSNKKSKYATEKKIYTSLPYIRVGFNFHLPHTFSVDSTMVKGHWRFQPCGPERAFIKHIYIEPHTRHYKEI